MGSRGLAERNPRRGVDCGLKCPVVRRGHPTQWRAGTGPGTPSSYFPEPADAPHPMLLLLMLLLP